MLRCDIPVLFSTILFKGTVAQNAFVIKADSFAFFHYHTPQFFGAHSFVDESHIRIRICFIFTSQSVFVQNNIYVFRAALTAWSANSYSEKNSVGIWKTTRPSHDSSAARHMALVRFSCGISSKTSRGFMLRIAAI